MTSRHLITLSALTLMLAGCSGFRPDDLGIQADGQLRACPDRPNCVNSTAPTTDDTHTIAPFRPTEMSQAWSALQQVVASTERVEITDQSADYLRAEATTKWMRFVDDVEFRRDDQQQVIHLRSASRLGYRDFGVNRERIENWRSQLNEQGVLKPE